MCSTVVGGDRDMTMLFRVAAPDGRQIGYLRVVRDDLLFRGASSAQPGLRLWLWRAGDPPVHEEAFETEATFEVLEMLEHGRLDWYDELLEVDPITSAVDVEAAIAATGWLG
jgi:hypothetical protein